MSGYHSPHHPHHGFFGFELAAGYLRLLGVLCLISFILGIWLGAAASSSKSSFVPRWWKRLRGQAVVD